VLGFADGHAADRVAVEVEIDELAGRLLAEVGVDRALDDAEVALAAVARARAVLLDPVLATARPAGGQAERAGGVVLVAGVGRALVEEQ